MHCTEVPRYCTGVRGIEQMSRYSIMKNGHGWTVPLYLPNSITQFYQGPQA